MQGSAAMTLGDVGYYLLLAMAVPPILFEVAFFIDRYKHQFELRRSLIVRSAPAGVRHSG